MRIEKKNNRVLLEERRSSISYKINNRYIKYFKYANVEHAKYEFDMQNLFYRNGINTPRCFGYGFDDELNMSYIECEYYDLQRINYDKFRYQ